MAIPLTVADLYDAAAVLRRLTTTKDGRTFNPSMENRFELARVLEHEADTSRGYKHALKKVMHFLDEYGPEQEYPAEKAKYAFIRAELLALFEWIEDDAEVVL